jgi:hypothetical protein
MPSDQVLAARTPGGRFAPGHTGNPKGRPPGGRNHQSLAARLDRMVATEAVGIVAALLARAKAGDALAADVILARAWPAANGAAS